MNDTSTKDIPTPRALELKMCEIIERLYELQRDFTQVAAIGSDSLASFDNGIFDCVTACTGVIAERLKNAVLKA